MRKRERAAAFLSDESERASRGTCVCVRQAVSLFGRKLSSVHVGGISAGAYLAIVTARRATRRGLRVDSLFADEPMIGIPANGHELHEPIWPSFTRNWFSRACPPIWLQWCWQAFAQNCESPHCDTLFGAWPKPDEPQNKKHRRVLFVFTFLREREREMQIRFMMMMMLMWRESACRPPPAPRYDAAGETRSRRPSSSPRPAAR